MTNKKQILASTLSFEGVSEKEIAEMIVIPTDAVQTTTQNVLFSEMTGLGNATVAAPAEPKAKKADPCCDEDDYKAEKKRDSSK